MSLWFRQKFQLSRIFKKMFRSESLVRLRFKQKFQMSGIFEISKKVRNTIFTCTKKAMFPGYLFFILLQNIWKEFHGVFTLHFINFEATLINFSAFFFYTFSLWKYYSKLHHRLKACVWQEFCCCLKEFHGLTKYVVPPSIKNRTSKNQLTKQKQANTK